MSPQFVKQYFRKIRLTRASLARMTLSILLGAVVIAVIWPFIRGDAGLLDRGCRTSF